MAPRQTENNAYAKFWSDQQRALWYVVVFSGVVNYNECTLIYFFNGKNIIFILVRQLLYLLAVLSNNLPPLYLTFNVSGFLHFKTTQLPLQDVLSAGLPANQ